jgi:hypothetical protein
MNSYKQHENIPKRKPDTISTPYTDQFEAWLETARQDGLLYVNIFYGEGLNQNTVDYATFCEEFMKIRNSPDLSDKDVLGKYNPINF